MKYLKHFVVLLSIFLLVSCYSVRLRNVNGAPQTVAYSERDDYYRNLQVIEIDTVISKSGTSKDFTYPIKASDKCESGKINIIEYRNTFGGLLLNIITLGTKRKMKIKYVCEKPTN